MQITIFDHMNECTEPEVARLLNMVSPQRREQALRYKHLFSQYCCLKSYELLLQLLASTPYLLHSTPIFLYNEHGKPYLENGPYFSISHCKHAIAVAVSEIPIGIDIEHIRTAKPNLVAHTMNEEEQAYIWAAESPDIAFTCLWTQKEAVLKMQGTGIINDIKNTLVNIDDIHLQTHVNHEKQYVYSLVNAANAATV